jgi:acyl-coenzyme A thioesterase PaaI-like protein
VTAASSASGRPTALFLPDGHAFVPTPYARGPWDPRSLHGGPIGALLARAVEAAPDGDVTFDVARLTIELLRPVPLEALTVEAAVVRPGRKVQLVEATLRLAGTGTELAKARALRIRRADVPLPYDDPALAQHLEPEPPPPGPATARHERSTFSTDDVAFHRDGAEHRFVAGTWTEPGPVTVWIRLLVPVVPGEEPTGVQRAVAAADFGNGVSRVLPFETHLFINPDLTLHLLRPLSGEWVGMQTRSHIGPGGVGLAESALFDEHGRVGRSVQSLLVESR